MQTHKAGVREIETFNLVAQLLFFFPFLFWPWKLIEYVCIWSVNVELYVLHYGPVVVKHNFEACVSDPK